MAEVCFSYPFPTFQPAMRIVNSITNAVQALVTTSLDHQYIIGTFVRFYIPNGVGMEQINHQYGVILTIPTSTTFTVSIDTTNYDPFIIPSPAPAKYTCAQVVPFAEINSILTAAVQNVLPYSAT